MNKVGIEIIYFTSEFYRCITSGINQGLKKLGPDGVIKARSISSNVKTSPRLFTISMISIYSGTVKKQSDTRNSAYLMENTLISSQNCHNGLISKKNSMAEKAYMPKSPFSKRG